MKRPGSPAKVALALAAAAVLVVLGLQWRASRAAPAQTAAATAAPSRTGTAPVSTPVPPPPATPVTPPAAPTPGVALRPLAVSKETAAHAWTAEDARSPEVIRKIAHNEWEERRLLDENARITGRQLVYRKEPVFIAVERARAAGETLRAFTLPGFDGRELDVEVTRSDLDPSGLGGTLTGRLTGLGESIVTIAFKQGREAFTIVSPEDGTYLQGHPREPGELMISSFVPDTYLSIPGGEPIRTNEQLKPAQ